MPKKPESLVTSEKFSNVARLFWLYFGTPKKKQHALARFKPEIFVNFRSQTRLKQPGPISTLMYFAFKFTGLSLYVQYFTQKVIQLIYYTVGF